MKRVLIIAVMITEFVLSGCATQAVNIFDSFTATPLDTGSNLVKYIQKTDNLYVIIDASSSKSEIYEGTGFSSQSAPTKFSVSKEVLNRMNKTIPDINMQAGIRSFGFGPCLSWNFTIINHPISDYSMSAFGQGIDKLSCSSGGSPMRTALHAAADDLSSTTGNIALLVISDGHQLDNNPIPAIVSLKAKYGDRLCVYTVWVGNEKDRGGRHLLLQMSNKAGCGFSISAAEVASNKDMADFVERVFFDKTVAEPMHESDSDGDGVPDYRDTSPNTPAGARVNKLGSWAYEGVLFDFDKATIKTEYHEMLANAVQVMNMNPALTVQIQGHTDSKGSEAYNQGLSERRAQAVKDFIVNKGISAARMITQGFGESDPVASNATDAGRAQNRRVQFSITSR